MTNSSTHSSPSPSSGADSLDDSEVEQRLRDVGQSFVNSVCDAFELGALFQRGHVETQRVIEEFLTAFRAVAPALDGPVSVVLRDEFLFVQGTTIHLDRETKRRLDDLRGLFAGADIYGVELSDEVDTKAMAEFLRELHKINNREDVSGLERVDIPGLTFKVGQPTRPLEKMLAGVSEYEYVTHLYVRGVVKTRSFLRRIESGDAGSEETFDALRTILRSIASRFVDEDFTILGLPTLGLTTEERASHALNSAIYAMLLTDRLGVPGRVVAATGAAVIAQDADRLRGAELPVPGRPAESSPQELYSRNLRIVAKQLDRLDETVEATLRMVLSYERGTNLGRRLGEPFYRTTRTRHLAGRIIDVARAYDIFIQGLEGYEPMSPRGALEMLAQSSEREFDSGLIELLQASVGAFPIGTVVELSTGDRAVVIEPPGPTIDLRRPKVRLLGERRRVVDLGENRYREVHIERAINAAAQQLGFRPSEVYLLT